MLKVTYIDYNNKSAVLLIVEANSLVEADATFEKETGQNPIKTKNIGAKVEKIN